MFSCVLVRVTMNKKRAKGIVFLSLSGAFSLFFYGFLPFSFHNKVQFIRSLRGHSPELKFFGRTNSNFFTVKFISDYAIAYFLHFQSQSRACVQVPLCWLGNILSYNSTALWNLLRFAICCHFYFKMDFQVTISYSQMSLFNSKQPFSFFKHSNSLTICCKGWTHTLLHPVFR